MTAGRRLAFPALMAGAIAIALAPILVRYAVLENIGRTAAGFWRLFLALPLLALWSGVEGGPRSSARDRWVLFGAGVFFALDLAFWHASIVMTQVAQATILACFAPVLVTLGAWLFFGERIRPGFLAGLAVAIAGAVLLMGVDARHLLGNALGIVAAAFYAVYLLAIGRLRGRCSTATTMAWSGAGASIGLLAAALVLRENILPATPRGWLLMAAFALSCQIAGQTLIAFALAHLSVAFSAVGLLVQPVVAAALGWWLFSERLDAVQIGGGVLVLAGIAAARLGSLQKA